MPSQEVQEDRSVHAAKEKKKMESKEDDNDSSISTKRHVKAYIRS